MLYEVITIWRFQTKADLAKVAEALGCAAFRVERPGQLKELLPKAWAMNKPVVIDVYMKNIPTPTAGHWNIMDIYSPGKKVHSYNFV